MSQHGRIILAYKNFAANKNVCHIGLGVAAMNTTKTLAREGIVSDVWPTLDGNHLRQQLNLDLDANRPGTPPITHVVISAPWIESDGLVQLTRLFPRIQFAVNCHSNVGFLQADWNGTKLVREAIRLEHATDNLHIAGNCQRFCKWMRAAYEIPCTFLPNLYAMPQQRPSRPVWNGGKLRIGAFGAVRPLKNFMTGIAAAIQISHELKAETEVWMSGGRAEGGGEVVLRAAQELIKDLPLLSLRTNQWQPWPQFVKTIGHMHLVMQPSYTESFNMVVADGVSQGVPAVTSEAIDWTPKDWQAPVDDAYEMATIGRKLILDPHAAHEGWKHLEHYVRTGTSAWKDYLSGHSQHSRY